MMHACDRQISCNATRCMACNLHRSRPRRQTFDKWESIESADAGVGLLPSDNKNNRGAKNNRCYNNNNKMKRKKISSRLCKYLVYSVTEWISQVSLVGRFW